MQPKKNSKEVRQAHEQPASADREYERGGKSQKASQVINKKNWVRERKRKNTLKTRKHKGRRREFCV